MRSDNRPIADVSTRQAGVLMHIRRFQIQNYKGFRDTGLVDLSPGMNLVVGQNDAGKSALLDALSTSFQDVPHRSQRVSPRPSTALPQKSMLTAEIVLTAADIADMLAGLQLLWVPSAIADWFPNISSGAVM